MILLILKKTIELRLTNRQQMFNRLIKILYSNFKKKSQGISNTNKKYLCHFDV